jgi:hypothetical protein
MGHRIRKRKNRIAMNCERGIWDTGAELRCSLEFGLRAQRRGQGLCLNNLRG